MSKLLHSVSSSSFRYRRSMDVNGLGKMTSDGTRKSAAPFSGFRVPKKLRVLKLGSRRTACDGNNVQVGTSADPIEEPSASFLGRVRLVYERMMVRAASKSGLVSAVPVAKASRAPPALTSAVSNFPVWSTFGSGLGTKVSELDPGFKLTAAEKKYLEHLKRTASS